MISLQEYSMKITKSKLKEMIKTELTEANDGELADPFWDFNEAFDKLRNQLDVTPRGKDYTKDKKLHQIIKASKKAMHLLYNHLKNNAYIR